MHKMLHDLNKARDVSEWSAGLSSGCILIRRKMSISVNRFQMQGNKLLATVQVSDGWGGAAIDLRG